jgi:hypothetical protein
MMQNNGWIAIAALLVASAAAGAQGPGGGFGFGGGFGPGGGPGGAGKTVTGEPFSDTSTSTSIEKLADGATITHSSTMTEARDSQGRIVRTVTNTTAGTSSTHTTVTDPVAHTVTSWSSQSTVANVMQLPNFGGGRGGHGEGPPPGAGGPPSGGRPHPNVTRVALAAKTIAGVPAEGFSITTTIPAGAEGNDKPLVSTREVWTSTDLKIVLLETSDSPRDGSHKMEVTSLSENEPNPSVFQVPQGYTVKQEKGRHGR